MQDQSSYTFGPYRLLPQERQLLRDGTPVPLAPKAFDMLVALVRRAGRLATKEELLAEVWPDAFVEESNLTQNVFGLRRALGETGEGQPYIETVPKRGYRFAAGVTVDPPRLMPAAPAAASAPVRAAWSIERAVMVASIAGLLILAVLLVKAWRQPPAPPLLDEMTLTRLTTSGNVGNVAISPDGKYVTHAVRENAQQSLMVRQIATQSLVQIVPPANVGYVGLAFSPDSNYIYYNLSSDGVVQRTLFQVPTLGGPPRKLLDNLRGGGVSLSPDGTQFAFIRVTPGRESALLIANTDGTGERKLVSNQTEDLDAPAWSPDGQRIAFSVTNRNSNDSTVFELQIADGSARPLTTRRWLRIIKLAWLRDGAGLLLLATPGDGFVYQIWRLAYPDGGATRVTNDLNN
jgi:DNA-binding winged helix-turn-helix (wHTH) protein/Tol biopolymer transport system component